MVAGQVPGPLFAGVTEQPSEFLSVIPGNDTTKPLYPFGWGLSYATFQYANPRWLRTRSVRRERPKYRWT
jgi:hypothetical protein